MPYVQKLPINYLGIPSSSERVTKETEIVQGSGSGNIPRAAVGAPVASVLGQRRVNDPNTIWTGNLKPLTEVTTSSLTSTETYEKKETFGGVTTTTLVTETVTTITTTTTIIGYLVDIHMGVCLGPDAHIVAIYVDNILVWEGDIGPNRTEFNIGKNETFLSGATCIFSGGAYNQAPEPEINVPDYPGYVGVATLLMKNVRADLPMGNLSFEVYRNPNPLSLPAIENKSGNDLNLMSAAVEVMTNPWGWGGIDISALDTTALSAIASELASEDNFCSIKVGSETSIASLLKAIQNQGFLYIFQDPETGLITAKLIRTNSVDVVSSLQFGLDNIISISSLRKTWWQSSVDQARGVYTDRAANYEQVPIFIQNAAKINQSGRGRKTYSIEYPFVMNKNLALDLVERDLDRVSSPMIVLVINVNREGASAVPGDIVFVSHPDYSLVSIPMIVEKVRKQPIDKNLVTLELLQAKTPNNVILFGPGADGYDPGFDTSAVTPTGVRIVSAPYFIARAARSLDSTQISKFVYPILLPRPANNLQYSFSTIIENEPGSVADTQILQQGLYPTYSLLNGALSRFDGFNTGLVNEITIDSVVNPINLIQSIGEAGVRDGRLFLFINDEIMSFESVTDNMDGSYTLSNVRRGLLDTVPQTHADNSSAYIINNNFNFVARGFSIPMGYTPDWVFTSNTITDFGRKEEGLSYNGWSPTNVRVLSPPAPHDTRVQSQRSETPLVVVEGTEITVDWKIRSRLNQKVRLQTDASDTPELTADVTQGFRVYHRSSSGTITEIGAQLYETDTATFFMPDVTNGEGSIFVSSIMEYGGDEYSSLYRDLIPVEIVSGDFYLSEDESNIFISEDGNSYFQQEA